MIWSLPREYVAMPGSSQALHFWGQRKKSVRLIGERVEKEHTVLLELVSLQQPEEVDIIPFKI